MYDSDNILYESREFQKYRIKKESGEEINIKNVTREEMLNMFSIHSNSEIAKLFGVTDRVVQYRRYKLGVKLQDLVYRDGITDLI